MRTFFSIFVLLLSLPAGASTLISPFCLSSLTLQEQVALYRKNHIKKNRDGVSVLIADPETGRLSAEHAPSESMAIRNLIRRGQLPLELDQWIRDAQDWEFETHLLELLFRPQSRAASSVIAVSMRVKDPKSLKGKLFERARKFPNYTLKEVGDLTGLRFIVKTHQEAQHLANHLMVIAPWIGIGSPERPTVSILQKVHPETSAIHLQVKVHLDEPKKFPKKFEIQILPEYLVDWYDWDHDTVYKSESREGDPAYFSALKAYSKRIHSFIRGEDSERPSFTQFGIRPEHAMPGF